MVSFIVELIEKLWDTWNIRGLIILSLFLQSFLILFAPLRSQRGGKWVVRIPIWMAYLLADWVAIFTIGLILRAERSDILALWAPLLSLHLGGPDTITSFSLEDNELWIRHLLGLLLQVGATVCIILLSLSNDKLWLPTLPVLVAGIIKYAERNRAFYLASFDNFGNNWAPPISDLIPPAPKQFAKFVKQFIIEETTEVAPVYLFGAIKNLLVGPPMSSLQKWHFDKVIQKMGSLEMLRITEIHLSLLYELLYTKLPVVDSKIGYVCRIVNFGCILGSLLSFSLLKKYYYKLGEFDIWLTYGLLIGALALDLISSILLCYSDWVFIAHSNANRKGFNFIYNYKGRWSNSIPQLNILTCRFKNKDGELIDFLGIRSLFETIRRIRCVSFEDFAESQVWKFIFTTLKGNHHTGKGIYPVILQGVTDSDFAWSINKFEYMESLMIWHIATEICYRRDQVYLTSTSKSLDYRKICKLLSDYMFYLIVMEPTMIATSPNSLKIVFEGADLNNWEWPCKGSKETFVLNLEELLDRGKKDVEKLLKKISRDANKLTLRQKTKIDEFSRVTAACYLAKELLKQHNGCPWELMSKVWVELVCYAAINCKPIVHARQVSKGGQLLTLVWLLMNYLGLEREEPVDQENELDQ